MKKETFWDKKTTIQVLSPIIAFAIAMILFYGDLRGHLIDDFSHLDTQEERTILQEVRPHVKMDELRNTNQTEDIHALQTDQAVAEKRIDTIENILADMNRKIDLLLERTAK